MSKIITSKKQNNIFLNPQANIKDKAYIGFFFLIIVILFYNFVSSSNYKSFGDIYMPLAVISLVILSISLLMHKNSVFSEVIYGKIKNVKGLLISMSIGFAVGIFLIVSSNTFSILPFSIVANSSLISNLTLLFVIGFVGVEVEEMFFASTTFPTFQKFFNGGAEIPVVFIVAGLIFFFSFGQSGIFLSLIFFGVAIAFVFSNFIRKELKKTIARVGINMLLIAIIFGLVHIYAYQSSPNLIYLMFEAMLFRFVVDVINFFREDTISSRITHSINNSFVGSTIMNISPLLAIFVVGTYSAIIFIIFKFS